MKRFLARFAVLLLLSPAIAWAAGAVYFDLPAGEYLRHALALAWILAAVLTLFVLEELFRALLALAIAFGVILGGWLSIRPRQDRDWLPEVARTAHSTREGDAITLHDVRDFEYRTETDFTPRYHDRVVHLDKVRGLDVFLCYWGSPWMAHPIFSFDFGEEGHVCVSVETRKEKGEGYSTLGGLYRMFELIYVVAEEADVVRLRSELREGEEAYRYRILAPAEGVRELFLEFVRRIDELHETPEFYNVLTANCTTSVRMMRAPEERAPFDYRLLLNGKSDELLYERGLIDRSLPFAELKKRAHVPRTSGDMAGFSEQIRSSDASLAGGASAAK